MLSEGGGSLVVVRCAAWCSMDENEAGMRSAAAAAVAAAAAAVVVALSLVVERRGVSSGAVLRSIGVG